MKGHRVWAEVNLSNLSKNLARIRNELKPSTKILAVVKANGYGHGAVAISHQALKSGAYMLGVGDSQEAIELRESGITGRILILGAIIEEEIPKVIEYDISVTIHSKDLLKLLNTHARRQGKILKTHLKIDTGMTRLGTSPENASRLAENILTYPNLKLEGICTHFSSIASGNVEYTRTQIDKFKRTLSSLDHLNLNGAIVHAANSAATIILRGSHFDMVRTGIALYGIDTGIFKSNGASLEPVLSLKTQIAFIKHVKKGISIGYNQKYITEKDTLIATCPMGYNDGYPFALANKGEVLVKGKRARVIGTITMDYIMIDVGHISGVKSGDLVTVIGCDGSEEITAAEIARLAQTVPHEITCRLGTRVKRIYKKETKVSKALMQTRL